MENKLESQKKLYFDYKWVIIFLIVGFLIVFQVLPLVYLLVRSMFINGRFSGVG